MGGAAGFRSAGAQARTTAAERTADHSEPRITVPVGRRTRGSYVLDTGAATAVRSLFPAGIEVGVIEGRRGRRRFSGSLLANPGRVILAVDSDFFWGVAGEVSTAREAPEI